jgi:hypothetical protein
MIGLHVTIRMENGTLRALNRTIIGLHGAIGTRNALNGMLNSLHGTIPMENRTLNDLDQMIRTDNDSNGVALFPSLHFGNSPVFFYEYYIYLQT